MKSFFNLNFLIIFFVINANAQQNIIKLRSLPGGTEGNSIFTDASTLRIGASGIVTYLNSTTTDDFAVTASNVTFSSAFNSSFKLTCGASAVVSQSPGKTFGSKVTSGGIDRDVNGELGVRTGQSTGIDTGEGIFFGLDLSTLKTSVSIRIKKISVNYVSNSNESGVVVSRLNTSKKYIFGLATNPTVTHSLVGGAGEIDLSSFNITLAGGSVNSDLVSIFNNSPTSNAFRVTGVELEVLNNSFDLTLVANKQHPRLLLNKGQESTISSIINKSKGVKDIHDYLIEECDSILMLPPQTYNVVNGRMLDVSMESIKRIFYLSYGYRMTKKVEYLTRAEETINTVCDFPDWITYSLDTSEMCFAVAIGYDWLFDELSSDTKAKARNRILNYAFKTQKNKGFWDSTSNWNQVCIGALAYGAMAIYGDGTAEMNTEAAFVLNSILAKNPNSLNEYDNGNYSEGPAYWSYGTSYQVLLLSGLESIFGTNHEGINRLTNSPGFLESARYMQYVTGPTNLIFNYADGDERRVPAPVAMWMAKKLNDTSVLNLEAEMINNGTYLDAISADRFLPIAVLYAKDIDFTNIATPVKKVWEGYGAQPVVLVRTEWKGATGKYLGAKAGTPYYSHANMDCGAFVYDSQGIRWAMGFGKFAYSVSSIVNVGYTGDPYGQDSPRWSIFRVSNISENTISIKKATETNWQRHKSIGIATLDEVYDTDAKRGGKINLKDVVGLNNELNVINRSVFLENESNLKIEDYIENGAEAVDVYWNMVTRAIISPLSPSKLRLTFGGKSVVFEVVSSNPAVPFTIEYNRSTDPVTYLPAATYDTKNPGTFMLGFVSRIPANEKVTFTVKITDDIELLPSSNQSVNNILLEMPFPVTGLRGNSLFYDQSSFYIDKLGKVNIFGYSTQYAWNVFGQTDVASLPDSIFYFRWDSMGSTNTSPGPNFGALLTRTGMDRISNGDLGVRRGPSNGIDPNEGFRFGLNLTGVSPNVVLKLSKIGFNFVGGTDRGTVVNRKDTSKSLTFGASGSGANVAVSGGYVDVESLGITIRGGQYEDDIASIFNSGATGDFRWSKIVFKVYSDPLPLGVDDFNNNNTKEIIVYPNPFVDTVTIKNILDTSEDINIKIFNFAGSCLIDKKINTLSADNEIAVELQSLKSGIYMLQIIQKDKISIKKIIKQ